jgi:Zn-dependent oligopeptidase
LINFETRIAHIRVIVLGYSCDRRSSEKLSTVDQAMANTVEGEIREFVRRDVSVQHRQRSEANAVNSPAAENLNALIQRVAGDSMEEIDRVIRELESVRDMLRNEGERVSREVAGYASLSHAATTAMKVIADSVKQWKDAPDMSGPRSVS